MSDHTVTVEHDPTRSRMLGRWSYETHNARGSRVDHDYCLLSRRGAERKARRYLKRAASGRKFSYSFTVPGGGAK